MASCKFEGGKYHGATEVKAHFRHDDISLESRKIASINNPHIDLSKCFLNKSLLGLTYEQVCKKYDERIAYLDATTNTNKRKDRVTLQNIVIPVPRNLERKAYNLWFIQVAKRLCELYGSDNFIQGQIHYDEEHEFLDANTQERTMSRVHAHFSIVPEINGVLNCKKMSSRSSMKKLNFVVDSTSKSLFECNFLDGTKRKSRQTIDELKNESTRLEVKEQLDNIQANKESLNKEKAEFEVYRVSQSNLLQKQKIELEKREVQVNEATINNLVDSQKLLTRSKQIYNSLEDNKKRIYHTQLVKLDEELAPHFSKPKENQRSL